LRHYPIPPEKVFVAYNGVDTVKFRPEKAGKARAEVRARYGYGDEPVALFVGSGFGRKGLTAVIKALPVVKTISQDINRLRLLVVGKDDPGPYMRLAARLSVADKVTFAGATTRPEEFYGAADIFVLPTKYDPFSNATLEAMACGLPVVTTSQNGVAELIADGEDGFVIKDPDDFTALAATLAYLSCEKARMRTGERARRVAEGLTWEKTLKKTLEVYGS
jgi:UDP-glucose:(heptosyl)LPS alpha-1,3-glucosyltransferase